MASPAPSSPRPSDQAVPDEDEATPARLPLTMSASVVLSALPRDAHDALRRVGESEGDRKVKIRLTPLPNAPSLAQKTFKISVNNRFSTVITFLRKKLRLPREEGVFCYVNSVFAPGLDESVGGLWDCFKTGLKGDEALVVGYSMTPAFG